MRGFQTSIVRFLRDEDGPTSVEYAVMLALIIVVCIAAVTALGVNANNTYGYVAGKVRPTGS
ncbi:MAG TPA: Flp family type IVb pilin [Gemmataceae bacterium]|nr:Flp family type IVb pilin [Gemmataceae bacterium]